MILQRFNVIEGDYGFEPGTSSPEVWHTTKKPPHLHENHNSNKYLIGKF